MKKKYETLKPISRTPESLDRLMQDAYERLSFRRQPFTCWTAELNRRLRWVDGHMPTSIWSSVCPELWLLKDNRDLTCVGWQVHPEKQGTTNEGRFEFNLRSYYIR